MQCDDDSEFLINNSKNKKNPGIFSFLLQHGMKDLFLTYFLPDFFSPQEIIQIFCSHHASNRALRKEILTCESLWDLQFKYLFPTLYEMKNQILNSQWWTSQREEQLNQLVDESRDVFIFSSDGQSLIPLDQHEEYTKEMIRISCRNEVMSLVFGMMIDHAFYETNFYENDNITSTHYAKNFVLLRFFYLMIKSNRLLDTTTRYEGLSIHKIMQNNFMKQQQQQRIPPRFHMMDYFKIYESLLVDMIFKTNMPLAAYSLLKFGWSDACDDEKIPSDETTYYLPYIDFSYGDRRSYYNRFFQIHPFVKLNECNETNCDNRKITELHCVIKYQSGIYCTIVIDEDHKQLIYPRDLPKMIDMFETFCIRTHEAYKVDIPFSNIMGGRFNLDFALSYAHSKSGDCTNCQLGQIPMYHMHYQRTNCVDLQYSIRLYYQKRVDYLVHKLMSCFDRNELQANATLICSALSQYPSPEEISHLLRDSSDYQEIFPFDDPSYAQQRSTVFVELKKKIWNAYRGTFKTESSLVRAIDKCIRRYIHLFVVAQPHMTRHNSYIFMSLERVIYKNCASFIYCINLTLLPHVCSLVKYRMERCLLASKTNSQHPCMTDSFEKIQQQFDHIFNQLNFLNEPLLLP